MSEQAPLRELLTPLQLLLTSLLPDFRTILLFNTIRTIEYIMQRAKHSPKRKMPAEFFSTEYSKKMFVGVTDDTDNTD